MNSKVKLATIIVILVLLAVGLFFVPPINSSIKHSTSTLYRIRGDAALSKGSYEQAIKFYYQGLRFVPENARIYTRLSLVYQKQEKYDEAIQSATKAIELDSQLPQAYLNLATSFQAVGRYNDALEMSARSLETDPSFFQGYLTLGLIYEETGNYDEAVEVYLLALGKNPRFHMARYRLALCYLKLDENKLALRQYEILKSTIASLARRLASDLTKQLNQ
ncbi:tetratricopeptide repeat protein [Candidatus Omnitrophota bacterium]